MVFIVEGVATLRVLVVYNFLHFIAFTNSSCLFFLSSVVGHCHHFISGVDEDYIKIIATVAVHT